MSTHPAGLHEDPTLPSLFGRGAREILASTLHHSGALRGISQLRSKRPPRSLAVLAYHRLIEAHPGPVAPVERFADNVIEGDGQRFERQLRMLGANRNVIGLDQLHAGLHGGERLPPAPLLITFDDGYRSCIDVALPILRKLNLRATFFIATDYLQERRLFWWDAVSYLVKKSTADRIELELPAAVTLDRRVPGSLVEFLWMVERLPNFDMRGLIDQPSERTGVEWSRAIETRLADELLMTWNDVQQLRAQGMDVAAHTRIRCRWAPRARHRGSESCRRPRRRGCGTRRRPPRCSTQPACRGPRRRPGPRIRRSPEAEAPR